MRTFYYSKEWKVKNTALESVFIKVGNLSNVSVMVLNSLLTLILRAWKTLTRVAKSVIPLTLDSTIDYFKSYVVLIPWLSQYSIILSANYWLYFKSPLISSIWDKVRASKLAS